MLRRALLVASPCLLLLQGCTLQADRSVPKEEGRPIRVSMIQLLASPEQFEGRSVRVQGFCHLESEERALYLNREDAEYVNILNSVWLAPSKDGDRIEEASVIVEGTFTAKEHGHLDLWPAAIRDITKLERAMSRSEYRKLIGK